MPLSPESKANPTGPHSRRHHRRFYGLSDEKQRQVFQQQRDALADAFYALEKCFSAELDAKLQSLNEEPDAPLS
jgi:hypothetical protein